ncbi:MAG: hypothetical protein PHQ58_22380 [Rhodoferax sp.]|uniref:hypothetical protein n=1 Tax=Rhodoferax sp. TaxID=50421 RepID=UPI002621DC85|nr:hypothetical protein [Rhodoferax sp.]MDD2883168.1 hypothetical protein [Rhodoferax sp.]
MEQQPSLKFSLSSHYLARGGALAESVAKSIGLVHADDQPMQLSRPWIGAQRQTVALLKILQRKLGYQLIGTGFGVFSRLEASCCRLRAKGFYVLAHHARLFNQQRLEKILH